MLARLGLRRATDGAADPARLAAVGGAVRARLLADPRAIPRGGADADLFALPGFVPDERCEELIALIESEATASTLFDDGNAAPDTRTSSTHYFRDHPLARRLATEIDATLGLERGHAEPLQGQRYRTGEQYRHHSDHFRLERAHWQRERLRGGQRSWTAMLYLNSVEAGGETDFPKLGLAVRPERGLLLAWNNMDRGGRPNPRLLHAGLPVARGVKYVITQWYRVEPWLGLPPC